MSQEDFPKDANGDWDWRKDRKCNPRLSREWLTGFCRDELRLAVFTEPWNDSWWPQSRGLHAAKAEEKYYAGIW